ncbi:MAG: SH3 domain-containing protein [SAR324 cluster bacterium]|nr:SH3 domain-containing protein [SAR324 cluster bacterium]
MKDRISTPEKLALACLIWLLMASAAWAEIAIVTESWLRLRSAPDKAAKAIGLVYGNDVYPVLKKEEAWVQLRTPQGQVGWVEARSVELTEQQDTTADPERGKALNQAAILQRQGYRDKAATGLAAVAESYPDTYEQHEAVRHLLYYYPISTLVKPSSEQVHPASVRAARKIAPVVVDCAKRGVKPKWKKPWLMKASEEMEDGGSGAKPPQADAATKSRRSNCL